MSNPIYLSYCPIDPVAIKNVLQQYDGLPHENIVSDFETKLSEITKAKRAVALSSGTAAIHLALKAVGVGPGDEVLVSAFTYVATLNPILYLGATPVLIDVELDTWNLDPTWVEKAIKDRLSKGIQPKALLVVHTYGMPAAMKDIELICRKHEIPIVEDAAEAIGSMTDAKFVGTFGKVGILSFNNNKILTTYGGGAILTDDVDIADKISFWSGQSRENKMHYEHKEIGYNYRMGPVNAAIGLSKVENLPGEIEQRRIVFDTYRNLLGESIFQYQVESPGSYSNRWLTCITLNPARSKDVTREKIRLALETNNIESRPLWKPMHQQPVFRDAPYYGSGVSEQLFENGLCLPSGSSLSGNDLNRIVSIVKQQFIA